MTLPNSDVVSSLERSIDAFVTLDAETFYSADFSLSKMTTDLYVRDPRFQEIGWGVKVNAAPAAWMTPAAFAAWVKTVDWARTAVLCHNAAFDLFILAERHGVVPALALDTLSMARALHGTEVGGSLAKLAVHYGAGEKGHEVILAKGKRLEDFTPEEYARYGAYCVNDVDLTYDIFQKMMAAGFPEFELWLVDTTLRMYVCPTFVLDVPLLQAFLVEEQTRKAELLARVSADKSILMSNEKFAALLLGLGVDPPRKLSPAALKKGEEKWTWAFSKADPGMQALLEHEDVDVATLAEARIGVKSTINETRTERFLKAGANGRSVPVGLKYAAAHTFRWGGGEKMNFQNLMRGGALRRSMLAPPGKVLVVADSSQIEPRITAWLAGHKTMLGIFRENDITKGDIYSAAGSEYFGRKLTKTDPERQVSKSMVIGLGFGMGTIKFAATLLKDKVQFTKADVAKYGVDLGRFRMNDWIMKRVEEMPSRLSLEDRIVHCAVTEYFVKKYRAVNAPIVGLWGDMEGCLRAMDEGREWRLGPLQAVRHGVLLPSGLTMRYPGLQSDDKGFSYMGGMRGKVRVKAYGGSMTENVVQALARIVVAEQMLRIRVAGYKICCMAHDEVVFVTDEANGGAALEFALAQMRIAPDWCAGLPLNAAGGFGKSYGALK